MNKREILILTFVLLAVLVRLIPHPPNFTPIIALALFCSTTFKNKLIGLSLPLLAMIISDLYLGFYSISLCVYGSFFLISILGTYWKKIKVTNVFISSLIFFIITNFGVWLMGYPKTIEGFLLCYTMAIPFYTNTMLSTLFFAGLIEFFIYSKYYLYLSDYKNKIN